MSEEYQNLADYAEKWVLSGNTKMNLCKTLAKKIGVSPRTIENYINGYSRTTEPKVLKALSKATNIPQDKIFSHY